MDDDRRLYTLDAGGDLAVRSEPRREIDLRIVPYGVVVETPEGLELFERGAFEGTAPGDVVLQLEHENPAAGVGVALEDRDDGAYMTVRASRTGRGDELLTLAADGVTRGASISYQRVAGGTRTEVRAGRRLMIHRRVRLRAVSTTWRPVYAEAQVLAVRSEPTMDHDTLDPATAAEPAPAIPPIATPAQAVDATTSDLLDRVDRLEERSRQDVTLPQLLGGPLHDTIDRRVTTDRALADVITTDNTGVVPDAFISEMIGIIDPARPFMASTRQLPTPAAGTRMVVPVIEQRPLVGKQATQKAEVASRKTIISTDDFAMETHAGAGDLSLQLIRRSSPEFLSLWLELLGEAYAVDTENAAVDALLAAAVNAGVASFDPLTGDISFGEAFLNAQAVSRRLFPDTLWLSTPAVAAFIDAKTDGTNLPMFGTIQLNAQANGGVSGSVSGLNVVHVPALDDETVDAIVGPSRGFAWAEDGTYTLQADVPAKAGRDVGLVGFTWFAPWYPGAFTTYALAGS